MSALAWDDVLPRASTPGFTEQANLVNKTSAEVFYMVKGLAKMTAVTNELMELAKEYTRLSEVTLSTAMDFAIALPTDVAQPEVSVDPDGEVAFDWIDENNMLSVSIGPEGGITYAGKFREESVSGTTHFRESIPNPLGEVLNNFRT
ncbi:hypothetical protein LBW56_24065 [Ralstonia solanacearum]|uniref:hypothetical protein n=1 Tax=Ralstonia solanacearum TaxID=305 RepID=UPI001FF8BCE3|nr:hypothetical protein [Ralstonia solanacearum]MDB0529749.1 hypothetical protein [Ralstonia solanacearum]